MFEITEEIRVCHFATETAKMQKWTDEAFTTSKWIVTISIISSFCIDCWCFLRRLSPVSKAMLPVTSTLWKPSVRVVRAIHPSNSWGQKLGWGLKKDTFFLKISWIRPGCHQYLKVPFQLKRLFWTSLKNSIIIFLQLHPSQKGLSAQENEHPIMEQPFHPQIACFQVGTCVRFKKTFY